MWKKSTVKLILAKVFEHEVHQVTPIYNIFVFTVGLEFPGQKGAKKWRLMLGEGLKPMEIYQTIFCS